MKMLHSNNIDIKIEITVTRQTKNECFNGDLWLSVGHALTLFNALPLDNYINTSQTLLVPLGTTNRINLLCNKLKEFPSL